MAESLGRRNISNDLAILPWRVIALGAGNPSTAGQEGGGGYLIKGTFEQDAGYHVVLLESSTSLIWEERLQVAQIQQRLKELNPKVEVPLPVLLTTLSTHLEAQQPGATYDLSPSLPPQNTPTKAAPPPPNHVTLSIHTMLASLPLKWNFELERSRDNKLSIEVVLPLLCMVDELVRRHRELQSLLLRKDREIQDYRDQGYKVSRRYLETPPFSQAAFESEMMKSVGFEESAGSGVHAFLQPACQDLYRDIAHMRTKISQRHSAAAAAGDNEAQSSLEDLPTAGGASSQNSSPVKRPLQTTAEESKGNEQSRREELERKLEESKSKPKKKKKKLM